MKHLYIFNEDSVAAAYGIGTYVRELASCLKKRFAVSVVCLFSDRHDKFQTESVDEIEYIYIPAYDTYKMNNSNYTEYNNKYYAGVAKFMRTYIDLKEEIIFQFNYNKQGVLVNQLKMHFTQATILFTIHSMTWTFAMNGDPNAFKKSVKSGNEDKIMINDLKTRSVYEAFLKEQELFRSAQHIISLSSATYKLLKNIYKIDKNKISTIPNGLNDIFQKISAKERTKLRDYYNIKEDEKIFLYVGRFEKTKGFLHLIKAFKDIVKSHSKCKLYLVGSGEVYYQEGLKEINPFFDKIILTGRLSQKEVYKFYQIADVGIIPSFHEQSSYTAIEMMMFGLYIISSNSYGLNEMFKDGINSQVVHTSYKKNEYEKKLFNAINKYLNSPQTEILQLQEKARETYEKNYSLQIMYAKTLEAIAKLKPQTRKV
ncbi:glycosyltransferase [Dysgonomonas sp. HDW5A]|uniref:glycosyltransferase n=1 Tax=Dysgonomonas sp. HDW5A TaxID=2714926 RepID=UPI00140A5991|nr:glycosyltransferase [Dysgonomonas sp. HDW5A]QIK61405.1 glycosyltransferase [Dysgonomonas sp. HDW5A]